jgi:hypothetical protein
VSSEALGRSEAAGHYVIVDIGLRMLKPRDLARAPGFPEDYVLDPIVRKLRRGKWVDARLTIAEPIEQQEKLRWGLLLQDVPA